MKINNDGLGALTNSTDGVARPGSERPGALAPGATNGTGDAVTLSTDAQRLAAAVEGQPAIRQDVVDRMKALLDDGQVGADVNRLADVIIDDWLLRSEG